MSRGVFYNILSVAVILFVYTVLIKWQPMWKNLFENVGSAAPEIKTFNINLNTAAAQMNATLKKATDEFEDMRGTMANMKDSVRGIEESVHGMDTTVKTISLIMPTAQQMGVVNGQMFEMRRGFTPGGMMQNVMPWK